MGHRKHVEPEEIGPDPVDLPYEPRPLKPGEEPCAQSGCTVPVMRYGGHWWHVAKAGKHRARPAVRHG
jgi:hypothetical protein